MVATLSRRVDACEGRIETRLADVVMRLERVERTRPANEECSCSGRVEAIAAKVCTENDAKPYYTGVAILGDAQSAVFVLFSFFGSRRGLSPQKRYD